VKVFLDECVDWRLMPELAGHDVSTARQMGWTTIKNGTLLALASQQFDKIWKAFLLLSSCSVRTRTDLQI
jgi:hypothetical protein